MAARKADAPAEEAHVMFESSYTSKLAIPASISHLVLPVVRLVEQDYNGGKYTYTAVDDTPRITLISAKDMTAAVVTAKLTGETQ